MCWKHQILLLGIQATGDKFFHRRCINSLTRRYKDKRKCDHFYRLVKQKKSKGSEKTTQAARNKVSMRITPIDSGG